MRAALIAVALGFLVHELCVSGYAPSLRYSGDLLLSVLILIFVAIGFHRRNRRITANFSTEERGRWYARRDRKNGLGGMGSSGVMMFVLWHGTPASHWDGRMELLAVGFLESVILWLYGTWQLRRRPSLAPGRVERGSS